MTGRKGLSALSARVAATAFAVAAATAFCADAPKSPNEVAPQPYYGRIAQRVAQMLPSYHVRPLSLNSEISAKAWTNLVTQYDFTHSTFLQSDLDGFAHMKTRLADAVRAGDVSFAYEVYRTFCKRITERVAFATNLLETGTFDFSVKEDYLWQRKDAPWPRTREEQDDIWRKRIKNELLSITLARELDAEEAAKEEKNAEKKDASAAGTNSVASASGASAKEDGDGDEIQAPALTPKETLVKRYRQYLSVFTEPDEETVLQHCLSALAQTMDPHSEYLSPERKEDFDIDMNLSLCGVGATLSQEDGALKVQKVIPGSPMARDGRIKPGDKIVGVGQGDGPIEDIMFQPMKKTIRKIRGPKDTAVTLEVVPRSDPSGATRKRIRLVRDDIALEEHAATGRVETVVLNGVTNLMGYVKLPGFYGTMDKKPNDPEYRSCSLDVARWIAQFNTRRVDGMILDLRGNGGGSLREAVLLTALFTRPGPVVQIRETRQLYVLPTFPDQPTFAFRRPLVVMIDRASASASEIVAGALQDTGRAIVVGDRQSHGKGTVQTVYPVGPETFGSVKITSARFYRITGSSTQVKGVASDVYLPSVLDGLDIGEDKLPGALPWSRIEPTVFEKLWNMQELVPALRENSTARLKDSAAWERHIRAVELFRESAERKTVPLERTARMKLMREEREMREFEDADDEMFDEDGEDELDAEADGRKREDVVLKEAFNVLADIVRLTNGEEAPPPPRNRPSAWFFGGE